MPSTSAVAASSAVMQHLNVSANATAYSSWLPSSPRELLKLPLNAVYRAEVLTFVTIPRHVARFVGLDNMVNGLWEGAAVIGEGDAVAAAGVANAAAEGATEAGANYAGLNFTDIFHAMRRFSGFFSYMTSRWSLACFSVALVLNRVTIYASTRRHLNLRWDRRLALRIIPILLFASQILILLRAIRCQTSPDYSTFRYGKPGKRLALDYAGEGGFLYTLSSTLLPWETDEQSCSAVNMARTANGSGIPYGSFALLWPVFMCLCLSHFVETLSCALQGRTVVTEAGMSIFEHSLAFAEAETMISQSVGLGLFGLSKSSASKDDSPLTAGGSASPIHLLTRAQVLERMNVTPELLLIALISCCNSLTSNLLDVFGKQGRYRLVNTTIWGLCFMGAMVWGFLDTTSLGSETGVLKFPTVCIVGFVPHLLILIGILICLCIYGMALVITAFSLPSDLPQPTSLRERFALAHANMQGANQIRNVRLNMHEDFYTTLLRVGYAALTAASEAVFLNEGKSVVARRMTWLEEDRLAEIEESRRKQPTRRRRWVESADPRFEAGEVFSFDIPRAPVEWESGYGREKKLQKPSNGSRQMQSQSSLGGVGAFQGATRCYHGFSFFRGIFFLLLRWFACGFIKILDRVGISARPQWLNKLTGAGRKGVPARSKEQPASLDFWILTDEGELELPEDNEFDVEKEMRKREAMNKTKWDEADETRFENKLYNWWKAGGSWGNQDHSPDYIPPDDDFDDTTSIISTTTDDSEWEDESDGRRTPTQENPFPASSREGIAVGETLLDTASLARLLDPRDKESKHEARVLAAHLAAERDGRIMTRSRFQRQMERDRAQVLLSSRYYRDGYFQTNGAQSSSDEKRRPTPEEEAEILENLILSRRQETSGTRSEEQTSWESGASGLGPDGPQCVICQTNPRSIITWPCRCLCVCEDCRVSLAMNNFGSCVTCRQEVGGFVRLWVP
ncbi:hypothetical protein VTN00DRAFT_3722 [Thermoascus crustaceus]|uniref:uncharacterized protein n=1 Tax=Thermoascus crustaceus TaxID=5088 RepID=UPI0037441154